MTETRHDLGCPRPVHGMPELQETLARCAAAGTELTGRLRRRRYAGGRRPRPPACDGGPPLPWFAAPLAARVRETDLLLLLGGEALLCMLPGLGRARAGRRFDRHRRPGSGPRRATRDRRARAGRRGGGADHAGAGRGAASPEPGRRPDAAVARARGRPAAPARRARVGAAHLRGRDARRRARPAGARRHRARHQQRPARNLRRVEVELGVGDGLLHGAVRRSRRRIRAGAAGPPGRPTPARASGSPWSSVRPRGGASGRRAAASGSSCASPRPRRTDRRTATPARPYSCRA